MENEKKILIKFILYFLFGFIIIFYGITHKVVPTVFADTIDVGYVTDKTTILYENNNAQAMVSLPVNNTLNQYLYNILVIQLNNVTITKDYTYMLELYLPESKLKNINNIYVVGGNNNGTTCQTIGMDNSNTSYPKIYFKCPVNLSSLTIGLNNDSPATSTESITTSSNFRWSYSYLRYYTEDDDIDLGPVISNATNNTNNIINNNNSNTDKIIQNQNDLFGSKCPNLIDLTKLNTGTLENSSGNLIDTSQSTLNSYNSSTGSVSFSTNYAWRGVVTDFIPVESSTQYSINFTSDKFVRAFAFQYGLNKNYLGSSLIAMLDSSVTLSSNTKYIRVVIETNTTNVGTVNVSSISLSIGSSSSFCEYGTYSSKLDEQNKTSKGILGKLGDLFNTLFSNEDADISGLNNMVGWLPPGPVDSIINLPLSFFNALTNTLSGTCQDVSLTLPFVNQTLVLPCFDAFMTRYLDNFSTFWTLVGSIVSIFILYNYLLALYKWVDDTLTFRENNLPGYYGDNWGGGA